MIIRKPYAFLIKNFRKIHILLLILSLYVAYKLIDVNSFVNEFMKLGTYDLYNDPITNHITTLLLISVFILIIGSGALILLLRYKKKPWKTYLVPFIEYLVLFFVLRMIKGFFGNYTDDVETTDLRMSRDLLLMFLVAQLPSIGIFIMRTFGLDVKKFNFNSDKEFLELSDEDREEVELRLDVDSDSIKRNFKKLWRNIVYVYQEHSGLCNSIFGIIIVLLIFNIYRFIFITNKTYRMGEDYNINGYTIRIDNAYYTDKDGGGNIISNKANFIVVSFSIKNNAGRRDFNFDNFHIKSGVHDYTTTGETYKREFSDLGVAVDDEVLLRHDTKLDGIMVYKVDKKRGKNYILYYQEEGRTNKLRKIKLNIKNLSKISKPIKLKVGDNMKIDMYDTHEEISFDSYKLEDKATYYVRECSSSECVRTGKDYNPRYGYKVLEINYSSLGFEVGNMIDFLDKYGKISYKDSDGIVQEIPVESAINNTYYGKVIYLLVPSSVKSDLSLDIICRDKEYIYSFN